MKISHLTKYFLISTIIISVFISCKKDDEIDPNDKNIVTLEFENFVGTNPLTLGSNTYTNSSGEDFTVSTLNYYVSNISIKKVDGTDVKFPDQYFLVRQSDPTTFIINLADVPAGDYKEISYNIGVDSTKSVSDVSQRKGVLDVADLGKEMYWAWNSGYIFMRMEGQSSAVPTRADGSKTYYLHTGGYGGYSAASKTANNNRMVTLAFPSNATVRRNISSEIHIFSDILKVFKGKTTIKLAEINNTHSPAVAVPIANNYMDMFIVDHVHNEKE